MTDSSVPELAVLFWAYKIISGVVQSIVIGPLLFTLYISDVMDSFVRSVSHGQHCSVQLHDDDLNMYSVIDTTDDIVQFQLHLDAFVIWFHKWHLSISSKNSVYYTLVL